MTEKITKIAAGASLKMFSLLLLALLTGTFALAQSKMEPAGLPIGVPGGEKDPTVTLTQNTTTPTPPALWDVQFNYDVTANGAGVGMAGIVFIGHEFWASKWASDTIVRFSPTGALRGYFTVSGVTGCRSMTYDGTNVYIANNTASIYRIDTTSKTVIGVITAPITQVRMMSYDPTANAGAGGFYIGNFNTDITLINMSGGVLNTITAVTHGLGGMYGCAWENQTAGGPYLWVFHQGGASSQAEIARLQLPSGTPTVATHDVMTDVGTGLTSGLAGGLYITDGLVSGQYTIVGLLQGSPNNLLFGYELNSFSQPAVDAGMSNARTVQGYTQIPLGHVSPISVSGTISNLGTDPLTTANLNVHIYGAGSTPLFTDVVSASNVLPGGSANLTSNGYTPAAVGNYTVYAFSTLGGGQTDLVSGNDSMMFTFSVTDSTFARDNGIPDGGNGYAVSATDWAYAVSIFKTEVPDTLSSVWIELANPVDGDTTFAVIASAPTGSPNALIATGTVNIINSGQNTYLLTFPGGVALTPGTYAIGCYEGANTTINLAQSPSVFTAGTNFFFTGGSGVWTASGIQTARFIRPNFGIPVLVGVEDEISASRVSVFPNPTNGQVFVALNDYNGPASIQVINTLGQTVYTSTMEAGVSRSEIQLGDQQSGIYFVRVIAGEQSVIKKINLTR